MEGLYCTSFTGQISLAKSEEKSQTKKSTPIVKSIHTVFVGCLVVQALLLPHHHYLIQKTVNKSCNAHQYRQ